MAYRESKFGLIARLDPVQARDQIVEAFKKTDDGKPGRANEKAAKYLDIGKSTLTRAIKQLEDAGLKVERPSDDPKPKAPPPKAKRKKTRRKARA